MRVLIVGTHNQEIATAIAMAVERGATLRHVPRPRPRSRSCAAGAAPSWC